MILLSVTLRFFHCFVTYVRSATKSKQRQPAPKPACLRAKGIPTMPLPTMVNIKLQVHPHKPLLCSCVGRTVWAFVVARVVVVEARWWCWATTTTRGRKNGDRSVSCNGIGWSVSNCLVVDRLYAKSNRMIVLVGLLGTQHATLSRAINRWQTSSSFWLWWSQVGLAWIWRYIFLSLSALVKFLDWESAPCRRRRFGLSKHSEVRHCYYIRLSIISTFIGSQRHSIRQPLYRPSFHPSIIRARLHTTTNAPTHTTNTESTNKDIVATLSFSFSSTTRVLSLPNKKTTTYDIRCWLTDALCWIIGHEPFFQPPN